MVLDLYWHRPCLPTRQIYLKQVWCFYFLRKNVNPFTHTNVKIEFLSTANTLKQCIQPEFYFTCLRVLETGSRCLLESLFYSKSLFQGAESLMRKTKQFGYIYNWKKCLQFKAVSKLSFILITNWTEHSNQWYSL